MAASMIMESEEEVDHEDEAIDDSAHEKLLNSIYELDGKTRKKNVIRGLPVGMSNLDFAVHAKAELLKIGPDDLKLKRQGTSSQLKKPLSSLEKEKVRRQVARDSMVNEANKWDPVVKELRLAPQTHFAQREHGVKMYEALKPKPFTPRTPLEKELYAALGKSQDVLRPDSELTEAEEKALKAMSLEEARARRAELMKHHELLSRMELKAKRLKKIKSKRYRKILRREKSAADKKELEQLQKTDPEAFLEKMEMIERARMEERLTLKHRGGGKFSRLHKAYSKFDDKTRSAVQDMLQKSRELTQRRQDADSSEDEEEEMEIVEGQDKSAEGVDKQQDVTDKSQSRKRPREPSEKEKNLLKSLSKKAGGWLDGPTTKFVYTDEKDASGSKEAEKEGDEVEEVSREKNTNEGQVSKTDSGSMSENSSSEKPKKVITKSLDSSKKRKIDENSDNEEEEVLLGTRASADSELISAGKRPLPPDEKEDKGQKKKKKRKKKKTEDSAIDAQKTVKKSKEVILQGVEENDDDGDDNDDEAEGETEDPLKVTMEELFADEDFVEEFAKEKAEAEEKAGPKIEDTKLPGWGSWAGPDYKEQMEKRKKRNKPKPKAAARKQSRQTHVWINPDRDEALRKLQPKKVPFPFTSVQQYEASLRQPVSRGFVRESSFKLLNKPEVVTKQGYIIKPLDKKDYFDDKTVKAAEEGDRNFGLDAEAPPKTGAGKKQGKRRSVR